MSSLLRLMARVEHRMNKKIPLNSILEAPFLLKRLEIFSMMKSKQQGSKMSERKSRDKSFKTSLVMSKMRRNLRKKW